MHIAIKLQPGPTDGITVWPSEAVTAHPTYLDLQWGGFVVQSYSLSLCIRLALRGGRRCRILGKEKKGAVFFFPFICGTVTIDWRSNSEEPQRHNQLGIRSDRRSGSRPGNQLLFTPSPGPTPAGVSKTAATIAGLVCSINRPECSAYASLLCVCGDATGRRPWRTEGASEAATALQTQLCLGLFRSANRVQHYVGLPSSCSIWKDLIGGKK